MPSSNLSHLLLVSFPGWGHARPLCVLAARLVSESDKVLVTVLTTPHMLDKTRFEISRQFETGSLALQRIRLVSVFQSDATDMMAVLGLFAKSYAPAYETLTLAKPITCSMTGTLFEAAPAPVAVILDFFALPQLQATRALTGRSVPVISWVTGGCSTFIRGWGPESFGGLGDFGAKVDAEVARTNKSALEVGEQLYRHTDGSLVQIPGIRAMYDHEFFPQKLPFEMPVSMLIRGGREYTCSFLMDSDAVLIASSDAYEKVSLDAVRAWFLELEKPVYAVGPLLPAGYASTRSDVNESNANVEVFLEDMLEKHGPRSVVFISFGTAFWPTKGEYLEEVVEALIKKSFPFILSHASPFAKVSAELSEKVQSWGLGLLTSWSPQQYILNHQARNGLVPHSRRARRICWPFDADQPTAAAHLTENLKAAFELIEVRTGLGLKPLHRTGKAPKGTREAVGVEIRAVLDACRGEEGKQLRRNAEQLKVEFAAAWEDGGAAKADLRRLLEKYA
ncbi:hypothetical protein D9615_005086 [Tricholomella constricta]|uniref:Glycosyltransferase n=1 Tax=Tricholomella constricta TaxID=117010 RepID=A0A8H5HGB7_9AGAR|nr:hypothetical protein D9615_005086 [Tricholomella constricta]